jgi:hypothetical protein
MTGAGDAKTGREQKTVFDVRHRQPSRSNCGASRMARNVQLASTAIQPMYPLEDFSMKRLIPALVSAALACGGAAVAQTNAPTDDTKLKGAERAAAQKQLRDERRADRADRERNPFAATPATPATPAVPPEAGSGTGANPAIPATPATPSSRSTDTTTSGMTSATTTSTGRGGGKSK